MKFRKDERRTLILDELRLTPHVRISLLAEKFGVTTETIRRDLDELSERGLVNRAYGGASARPMGIQPPARERGREQVEERLRMGSAAVGLLSPGEVIMIDGGSTTAQFAYHLGVSALRLTVITNSYPVAHSVAGVEEARVLMCPGEFDAAEAGVYGPDTTDFLKRFHANRAFIGASGIASDGFSDVNRAAVSVKRTMIERADETWLLVDHTKFDVRLLEIVAPLNALTGIVTDQLPSAGLRSALEKAGVDVRVVSQDGAGAAPVQAQSHETSTG